MGIGVFGGPKATREAPEQSTLSAVSLGSSPTSVSLTFATS